jgi:hypothetical protein
LAVNEESEAFLKGEFIHVGLFQVFFESIGHAVELHVVEFFQGLFSEHMLSPF